MELGKHDIRIACGYQVVKCFAGNGGNLGLSGDSGDWKLENGNLKPKSRKIGARGDPNRRRGKRLPPTREAQEKSEVKSPTRKTDVWATQIPFMIYRPDHPSRQFSAAATWRLSYPEMAKTCSLFPDNCLQSYRKDGMLRRNLWYPGLRPMSPSFRKSCSLALPSSCGFPPSGRR